MPRPTSLAAGAAALLALTACAGAREEQVRQALAAAPPPLALTETATGAAADLPARLEAGLPGQLAVAMERNPELQAAFHRWRASVLRISRARRLPEPVLGFGLFVSAVETRVGPQRARLGLSQTFPWPTRLTAGADAAAAEARAQARRFDALALAVGRRVTEGYWRLWVIRQNRATHTQHLEVLRALSESARARVATGATALADQQQVDLAVARLQDLLRGMDEAERATAAQLRATLGVPPGTRLPTPGEPPQASLPAESDAAMAAEARAHPAVEALTLGAEAKDALARAESAERLGGLTLSADWIITGANGTGLPEDGKDAVVVGAGLKVPLWQGSYGEAVEAAEAEATAQRADARAAADQAEAELEGALSAVRDATRRVQLHRTTLVPQAESALESVLGAYASGRGTVAQGLLAQRDLLDLRLELDRARAEHAIQWARLEQVVGHAVERVPLEEP
ncbi:MAG: TolC family protein [Deltaproteobacteria bacterium]|nr:TolC family protein [Deltaproteobacteria bacterium]